MQVKDGVLGPKVVQSIAVICVWIVTTNHPTHNHIPLPQLKICVMEWPPHANIKVSNVIGAIYMIQRIREIPEQTPRKALYKMSDECGNAMIHHRYHNI